MTALEIIKDVANGMFDVRHWGAAEADIECPGAGYHTNPGTTAKLYIDRVPTVSCMHRSCRSQVEEANAQLRSAVRAELRAAGLEPDFTPEQRAAWREMRAEAEAKSRRVLRLEAAARLEFLPKIAAAYRQPLVAWAAESPVPIIGTRPWHHKQMFLDALAPFANERWWSAPNKVDHGAGKPWAKRYFRKVGEWIARPDLTGRHIAPADFSAAAHMRTPLAVIRRKLMIIELDAHSSNYEEQKEVGCAVARWIVDENPSWGMNLFAIVDSGNKSAHCWLTWPNIDPEDYEKFKAIMTGLGADTAFDTLSHSFRMPGVMRLNGVTSPLDNNGTPLNEEGKPDEFNLFSVWKSCAWQKLIYLNPAAVEDYDRLPSSERTHGKTYDLEALSAKQRAGYSENDSVAYEQRDLCAAHRALIEREGL